MKENPNIDELLNSFIDGELTQRERIEVQRLISHNPQVAERLAELQRCKMLVDSLPCAEAPDGMAEQIKAALERRILSAQQPEHFDERAGARHLLVRKVVAAAAMIGLVAILAAVIYTIVGPERVTEEPIVSRDWRPPVIEVAVEKPSPSAVATAEKPVTETTVAVKGFNGLLEVKTGMLVAVDAFISKAIENNGLLSLAGPRNQQVKGVYALICSREALGLLLADLENVWARFDSATLFVETDQARGEVVVEAVTAEQIAEIANQGSIESRIEVAKGFAVLNNVAELLPGKEVFAAIDSRTEDLITIPKPVLTTGAKPIRKPPSRVKDEGQVHLTIVVTGAD